MPQPRFRAIWVAMILPLAAFLLLLWPRYGSADATSNAPAQGLRDNAPQVFALTNAKIVTAPGKVIERGTLVFRSGRIAEVGADVKAPPEARVYDMTGRTIYPGFIDAYTEPGSSAPRARRSGSSAAAPEELRNELATSGAKNWNSEITPQFRVASSFRNDEESNKAFRSQGFVARLIAPSRGIIKGTSVIATTGSGDASRTILSADAAQHVVLTIPRGGDREGYPDSPMGALTLVRQTLYDAQWYPQAIRTAEQNGKLAPPVKNDALDALASQIAAKTLFIIDASDELYAMRADRIGKEFDLPVIVRGSGNEYRRLDLIKETHRPIIVPLNFPKPPNVASPDLAMNVSLEEMMAWDIAPSNPAYLAKAGVEIAFTSQGLRDRGEFLKQLRKAVIRGLSPDDALKALTITPAKLFKLESDLGTIEPGKSASVIITDGDLFSEKTKVVETWVSGERFEVTTQPLFDVRGTWVLSAGDKQLTIKVSGTPDRLRGSLELAQAAATQPATTRGSSTQPSTIELNNLVLSDAQLSFTLKGDKLEQNGIVQVSAMVEGESLAGEIVGPDGSSKPLTGKRTARTEVGASTRPDDSDDKADVENKSGDEGESPRSRERSAQGPTSKPVIKDPLYQANWPLGDFGRVVSPDEKKVVYFINATVWTCAKQGIINNATIRTENGKIAEVSAAQIAPGSLADDVMVIDCQGKHLTPGIIDAHSHIATDGGVNEAGQAITAEVRIGDFIDPDDINIYRQLSGGVTSANILHGSANPIGGQNQVIKLRWGSGPEQMKFEDAPPGIKFALGENVKQSNWDIPDGQRTRYPQTRMGVVQIIRDEFKAAQDYRAAQKRFADQPSVMLPPRRDLELDAIAEILAHKRWIHCHSYRQDEILAFIRTLDDFGITIGSFQHILEGYKVADAMAKHGATASGFSDWWAYKLEVYDAIPYNGALMYAAGVPVSFNSDDAELARRLNLEAAKAVKYGGVPREEALKFVTLNAAKALRIDDRVGSIEVGKDADFALWSRDPLSTFSRCEQTWIDGKKYFDRQDDLKLREEQAKMRVALIQRILASGETAAGPDEGPPPRDTLWPREDEFCGHGEHSH